MGARKLSTNFRIVESTCAIFSVEIVMEDMVLAEGLDCTVTEV